MAGRGTSDRLKLGPMSASRIRIGDRAIAAPPSKRQANAWLAVDEGCEFIYLA